jgi:hypothetical protein
MSAEQVKSKSKTVIDNRESSFPVTVPAGEGRLIDEKTTVTSVTTLYEAALRAEGSVGIEVDPAWYKPNVYYWYYNIENVFPNAAATSRIALSSTNTAIDIKVLKMPKRGDEEAEIESYRSFNSDTAVVGFDDPAVSVSSTAKGTPPGPSPFLGSMNIEVQFVEKDLVVTTLEKRQSDEVDSVVPLEKRQAASETFRSLIGTRVQPIGNPSPITYAPNFVTASFSIPYDPHKVTIAKLGAEVINQAHGVEWGGRYTVYFS